MIAYQKACERLQDARTKAAIVKKNLVTKFLMEWQSELKPDHILWSFLIMAIV